MKKFLSFGLCFMIFLCSFVLCFASSSWVNGSGSSVLPESPATLSFPASNDSHEVQVYVNVATHSNSSPVYYYFLINSGGTSSIVFWSYDPAIIDFSYSYFGSDFTHVSLSTNYDSNNRVYFVSRPFWSLNSYDYSPSVSSSSISESLGFVVNSSPVPDNSVLTALTSIIHGCIAWVVSMAVAVKSNGLLLFFVLTIFVGVGIGLFNRFRKE